VELLPENVVAHIEPLCKQHVHKQTPQWWCLCVGLLTGPNTECHDWGAMENWSFWCAWDVDDDICNSAEDYCPTDAGLSACHMV
jgi:hypothetical protein